MPDKAKRPPSSAEIIAQRKPVQNVNEVHHDQLSKLEKVAVLITDKIGTMGFFLIIFTWTLIWTGYNILATEVPSLGLKSFDPFPAFVAYLLISNVIQILLMPLIMVGQNVQGRHADLRAEADFDVNVKAEREVEAILHHLEYQNRILIALVEKQGIRIAELVEEDNGS